MGSEGFYQRGRFVLWKYIISRASSAMLFILVIESLSKMIAKLQQEAGRGFSASIEGQKLCEDLSPPFFNDALVFLMPMQTSQHTCDRFSCGYK